MSIRNVKVRGETYKVGSDVEDVKVNGQSVVDEHIAEIEVPSLEGYATEQYVDESIADEVVNRNEAIANHHDSTKQDVIEDLADIREGASKGETALQPSALNPYRTSEAQDAIDETKVDKVEGKGLSANDYTNAEKTKLAGIEDGAEKNEPNTVVDANYVHTDNNFTTVQKNKLAGLENYDDTEVKGLITAEVEARTQTDETLQGNINTEATARQTADNGLQTQIDALVSKSDVVDVVNTYADLQAYDTSTLGDRDVIKVLTDSTHDNARSYYRWLIATETWTYIGSESVGYTKAEADTLLNAKVDKVTGKGLSANDFTDEEKNKLAGLENYDDTALKGRVQTIEGKEAGWDAKAEVSDIPTTLAELAGDSTHRLVTDTEKSTWNGKADTSDIPTDLADLNEDSTHRVVTDTEKAEWDGKQDEISDLATIRSGAELGSTALQEVPNTYRTSAEQDVIDNGKVDKVTGKGLIDEAPSDHERYVRKDGAWVKFAEPKIETFEDIQKLCRKGIAKDYLQIGQPFKFKRDNTDVECLVMGFVENNKTGSIKIKDNTLSEGVIFQTKDCLYSLQFDAKEAFYYAPDGLSAGDYSFVLGAHSWVSADVGKTFYFTLQNDVPVGGQLVWNQAYNATLEGATLSVYDSATDTTANETTTMSTTVKGGATSLGTIKNSFEGNFNSCQRALLGNNRWKESAMRQHLNSNAVAGSVWTPQNHWDRAPSWATSTKGFMNGLNADLTSYIAETEIDTYRNTVCDGGGLDTTEDKIFLVGRNELFMPTEGADNGVAWDYYKLGSVSQTAHTGADPIRVKGINGGAGTYWWERSPYVGNAHSVRIVYPDGSYSYSSAGNSYGVAPAFVIA